jgi:hypothetical protein
MNKYQAAKDGLYRPPGWGAPTIRDYPDHPGAKQKGGPSEAAANAIARSGRPKNIEQRCLAVLLAHGPMTADECATAIGENLLSVRPRFSVMKLNGQIEETGERRRNESGAPATVWRLVATTRPAGPQP